MDPSDLNRNDHRRAPPSRLSESKITSRTQATHILFTSSHPEASADLEHQQALIHPLSLMSGIEPPPNSPTNPETVIVQVPPSGQRPIMIPGFDTTKYGLPKKYIKIQSALPAQPIPKPHETPEVGRPSVSTSAEGSQLQSRSKVEVIQSPLTGETSIGATETHDISSSAASANPPKRQILDINAQHSNSEDISTTNCPGAAPVTHPSTNPPFISSKSQLSVHPILERAPRFLIEDLRIKNYHGQISNPVISGADTIPATETLQQKLRRVQEQAMQEIYRGWNSTKQVDSTSLPNLDLARRPLPEHAAAKVNTTVKSLLEICLTLPTPARFALGSANAMRGQETAQKGIFNTPNSLLRAENHLPGHQTRCESSAETNLADLPARGVAGHSIDFNMLGPRAETDDSVRAMNDVILFKNNVQQPEWRNSTANGGIMATPIDWNDRPRFNINTPAFQNSFNNWATATYALIAPRSPDLPFRSVPSSELLDLNNIPDGLSMVPCDMTINHKNCVYYGYSSNDHEIMLGSRPLLPQELTMEVNVDLSDISNKPILNETTELLVQSWLAHKELQREAGRVKMLEQYNPPAGVLLNQAVEAEAEPEPEPEPTKTIRPKINTLLRPARPGDLAQMTKIYNWHIENGPKTAEMTPVEESDMQSRFDSSTMAGLPVIVAVERSSKHAEFGNVIRKQHCVEYVTMTSERPSVLGKLRQEKVVGWASAMDFTCPDFVEHITAELEIYVDPEKRQQGVGSCLMDQLLNATSRCYHPRGGFPFMAPQPIAHYYHEGGGRGLAKTLFVVRYWQFSKAPKPDKLEGKAKVAANPDERFNDQDNEFDAWLKGWIESWGFELQGDLKGVATKNGRFINMAYFARDTGWLPREGKIPTPTSSEVLAAAYTGIHL